MMAAQTAPESQKKSVSWRKHVYAAPVRSIFRSRGRVSQQQRDLVSTSFVLGLFSIVAAIFPLCGLPIALAGLILGLLGRRVPGLRRLAMWAVALSIVGGTLALINLLINISFSLMRL
ncbi:MAG: hypothetical protein E6J34_05175 [Chloroflexi bacterium]|nr:MAG: hypothetical protein E6J34_05175 [Chloroflexota bacterium]